MATSSTDAIEGGTTRGECRRRGPGLDRNNAD
jgi:hypothetical protein